MVFRGLNHKWTVGKQLEEKIIVMTVNERANKKGKFEKS